MVDNDHRNDWIDINSFEKEELKDLVWIGSLNMRKESKKILRF